MIKNLINLGDQDLIQKVFDFLNKYDKLISDSFDDFHQMKFALNKGYELCIQKFDSVILNALISFSIRQFEKANYL